MNVRVLSARCTASGGPDEETFVRLSLDVLSDDQGDAGPMTVRICLIDRRGAPVYGLAEIGRVAGEVEVDIPMKGLKDGVYTCYVLTSASGARFEGEPVEVEVSHGNA